MMERNWPAARDFLTSVTDPDDRAFYLGICADVDGVQEWIPDVVAAEPHSTLPLLVRGVHGVFWAWQARGDQAGRHTTEEQFRNFARRLKLGEDCLDEVIERDPDDTTAWTFLVVSARGRGVERVEADRRFADVVSRHPYHRIAHEHMLQYLCAKWCGSDEEMFQFARNAVAAAPGGSSLGQLIAVAHLEKWLRLPVDEDAAYMTSSDVVAELHAAADRSVRHPDHRRQPGWPGPHNVFAMAFAVAHEWQAAAEQMRIIGDEFVTEFPWGYLDRDVSSRFLTLRSATYEAAEAAQRDPRR